LQRNEGRRAARWKYHPNTGAPTAVHFLCAGAISSASSGSRSATDTNWQANDMVASAWHAEESQQELLVGRVGKEG
jgi:hypothetical protein